MSVKQKEKYKLVRNIDNEINYHVSIVGGGCVYGTLEYVTTRIARNMATVEEYVTNGYGMYAALTK